MVTDPLADAPPDVPPAADAARDESAFGEIYRHHARRIYAYVYRRVGNPSAAEDLTSRTFTQAFAAFGSYVDRGVPFSAWLYRIAHNVCANWLRDERDGAVSLAHLDLPDPTEWVGDAFAQQLLAVQRVREAVRRLSVERRSLVQLKFYEGLSNAEIADRLDRTESAIKSLVHRTLLELRRLVEGGVQVGGGA